jgi:hypothetical protein
MLNPSLLLSIPTTLAAYSSSSGGAFAVFPCCFISCFGLFAIASLAFWIWTIIEIATKEPSEGNDKIIWLLIVIFTHSIGALIYLLVRRPERIRKFGR